MPETVITCGGGSFFPVVVIFVIIISIISNAVKAAKEKKEREERMRSSGGAPKPSSPSPYAKPKPKKQSSSIEDFLRELSGGSSKRKQPQKQTEWHAPKEEVETYHAQKLREKEERQKRARELKEQEREKREREKQRREPERKRDEQRRVRKQKEAVSVQNFMEESRPRKKQKSIKDLEKDAYHVKETAHASVYDIKEASLIGIDVTSMRKSDLKKAIVLKEILGPPIALRKRDDFSM